MSCVLYRMMRECAAITDQVPKKGKLAVAHRRLGRPVQDAGQGKSLANL